MRLSWMLSLGLAFSAPVFAAGKAQQKPTKVKADADGFAAAASTNIDFNETLIQGKMQAPEGFFLQGHTPQALTQMVELRRNFRDELRNSKAAVKSLVK